MFDLHYLLHEDSLGQSSTRSRLANIVPDLNVPWFIASYAAGNVDHEAFHRPVNNWLSAAVSTAPLTPHGMRQVARATSRLQLLRALYGDPRFRDEVHARALEDWPVELILRAPSPPRRRSRLGGPVLSLLCDAQGAQPDEIERLIGSVREQTYPRWELCLCDNEDAPTLAHYAVDRHRGGDPRLRCLRVPSPRTPAEAVNQAAELLTGDYVGVVGIADELTPEALAYMVQALTERPTADVLYSDEEVRTPSGATTIRKPDWSPDLQTCRPYLGRLTLIRTELWLQLDGLDGRYPGAEEDALALQATEQATDVVHVPEVTCRCAVRSADDAATAAVVTDFIRDNDAAACVSEGLVSGTFRVDWPSPSSRGDVTVITVGSRPDAGVVALAGRGEAAERRTVRLLHTSSVDGAGLNAALQELSTEDVVFRSAAAAEVSEDWVEVLTGHARRLGVGLAAAQLRSDGPAALAEGLASTAFVHNGTTPAWPGVVATRRSLLRWMGGFDASLGVAAAVADLSTRLLRQGFRTVQTPFAETRLVAGRHLPTSSSRDASLG